jgi:hypothetical protein
MNELNILQMCNHIPPKYILNYNLNGLNTKYEPHNITDFVAWSNFIKENPCDKFKNMLELTESIELYHFRKYLFILYYLYVKGGLFINDNVIIETAFKQINLSSKIIIVESCINSENAFIECIYAYKNSKFIELLIEKIISKYKENVLKTDIEILNFITTTTLSFAKMTNNLKEQMIAFDLQNQMDIFDNVTICKEFIEDNVSHVYENEKSNIYFKHYFNPLVKIFTLPEYPSKIIRNIDVTNPSSIKIGVTVNLVSSVGEMFANGINQNTFYLVELLANIGYDVTLYVESCKLNSYTEKILKELLYDERFKYKPFSSVLNDDLDMLIQLSFSFWNDVKIVKYLKYTNVKLVGYFCGNAYIINSEKILYNQHKTRDNTRDCFNFALNDGSPVLDEIWIIPQMVNTNLYYWKTLYRTKCIEVPFIWSTKSFYFTMKILNISDETQLLYVNRGENKSVGIFEPNISIMKWCLPSVIICENTYRKNKKLKHVFITNISQSGSNGVNEFNLTTFTDAISNLDVFKDNICTVEPRFNTIDFMNKFCDVAVSHQWENPLNYLYFDLAWMGWPVVHNAHLCKDVGYFYDGFNYEEGGNVLSDVIENHDKNSEYLNRNRLAIDKYLPTNEELKNKYFSLISEVLIN